MGDPLTLPPVFGGSHVHDPRVRIVRARRIRIDAARVVAYADGERIGPLPLEIELVPGALAVLV
jgi:diacylglycerol kinase (ATP)